MVKERHLNIELLRIFSMLLITLWHVQIHFLAPMNLEPSVSKTFMDYVAMFIPFHVDLFLLITGYFGVRNCKKGLVKTMLLLYFYSIVLKAISCFAFGWETFGESLMPLANNTWWFMTMYIVLLLIAPMIESYIKVCSRRQFYMVVTFALFVNIYLNCIHQVGGISDGGFGIVNFVCIYILGTWIRKEGVGLLEKLPYPRITLSFCILLLIAFQYKAMGWNLCFNLTDYCGFYATLMSVFVFLLFTKVNVPECFRKVILFFSSSVVALYLITDHAGIKELLIPIFSSVYLPHQESVVGILIIVACILLAFVVSCLLDKIRIPITNFIEDRILRVLD